jgi:hypothetical protein
MALLKLNSGNLKKGLLEFDGNSGVFLDDTQSLSVVDSESSYSWNMRITNNSLTPTGAFQLRGTDRCIRSRVIPSISRIEIFNGYYGKYFSYDIDINKNLFFELNINDSSGTSFIESFSVNGKHQ